MTAILAPDAVQGEAPHQFQLTNGLRVALLPDPYACAVGICVAYGVGYRSETRPGFAHLFEHLMFQGGPGVPAQDYARLIQSHGGVFNGTTGRDHTWYISVLPPEALEVGLFLEADRINGPLLTQTAVDTQVAVVGEEINRSIRNRPYSGFPTFLLPPAAFSDWANAHDGYGDVASLGSSTVADCELFAAEHYRPDNAVLAVCGRFDVGATTELIGRLFGGSTARRTAAHPAPEPRFEPRDITVTDALAPTSALALGWRLPPPPGDDYLASIVLAAVLSAGDTSPLKRRARDESLAAQVMAFAGLTGPLDANDPDLFVVSGICPAGSGTDRLAAAIHEELDRVATDGVSPTALRRAVRWLQATWYQELDSVGARARRAAGYELLYGRAQLVTDAPHQLSTVDKSAVQRVARLLVEQNPAVVRVDPAVAQTKETAR